VMAVISVMVMIASLYLLVYFQSEEDHNTAYAPKVAVILGLTLTCLLVLMLKLDVANRNSGAGLPMELLWQIMFAPPPSPLACLPPPIVTACAGGA
jgi:LMBR1 domain-containing protein 1